HGIPQNHSVSFLPSFLSSFLPFFLSSFLSLILPLCDAAHCVATGYTCKSKLSCKHRLKQIPQNHSVTTMSTLECCHEDMCNYRGLHDILSPPKGNLITNVQELTSPKELQFRAAVTAVPIAGELILMLLIMLYLRMPRSENKRLQDQLQQMLSRLHYSFHGHHSKKGQVAKLDLECMVLVTGHENCCMTCDKMRHSDSFASPLGNVEQTWEAGICMTNYFLI
uniref:BMP and activin membrane-bound inhibitor homolog n=1 Tax=Anas zonorhyncha TaxID=75864 RepID=A0A8B9VBH8_9AVES